MLILSIEFPVENRIIYDYMYFESNTLFPQLSFQNIQYLLLNLLNGYLPEAVRETMMSFQVRR